MTMPFRLRENEGNTLLRKLVQKNSLSIPQQGYLNTVSMNKGHHFVFSLYKVTRTFEGKQDHNTFWLTDGEILQQ